MPRTQAYAAPGLGRQGDPQVRPLPPRVRALPVLPKAAVPAASPSSSAATPRKTRLDDVARGHSPTLRDLLRACLAKAEDDRPADARAVGRHSKCERRAIRPASRADRTDCRSTSRKPSPWSAARSTNRTVGFLCIHERPARSDGRKFTSPTTSNTGHGCGRQSRSPEVTLHGRSDCWARTACSPARRGLDERTEGQFQFWVARESCVTAGPAVSMTRRSRRRRRHAAHTARVSAASYCAFRRIVCVSSETAGHASPSRARHHGRRRHGGSRASRTAPRARVW